MTLYLKRFGWGLVVLMVGMVALFASMVRIVPSQPAHPAVEQALPHAAPAAAARSSHGMLAVPVEGVSRASITDTWGQSRANGARIHQATDIMAPGGARVVAAAPGTIEKLFFSRGGGGITLYVRSPDRRWSYYYAHLMGYAPGVHEGQAVRVGQLLGFVGDTGNSGTGNFHLHFAVARMLPEERWHQGEPINPYPLLTGRR